MLVSPLDLKHKIYRIRGSQKQNLLDYAPSNPKYFVTVHLVTREADAGCGVKEFKVSVHKGQHFLNKLGHFCSARTGNRNILGSTVLDRNYFVFDLLPFRKVCTQRSCAQ